MQVVHPRCCGLDVHKRTVVACVMLTTADGQVEKHVRTFSTLTADLLALSDWLDELGVDQIALESTGVYVRRITTRAIPPTGRIGSEGNPWVNNSPCGESQGGQQHVGDAERPRRRVGSGSARPGCYGESCIA